MLVSVFPRSIVIPGWSGWVSCSLWSQVLNSLQLSAWSGDWGEEVGAHWLNIFIQSILLSPQYFYTAIQPTESQCPQSQCLSGEANFLFAPELYSHVVAWTKLGDNVAGVDCTGQQQHPSSLNSGFSYNFVLGFAAFPGLHITKQSC